jgi:thiol-disulfide isomerase/thioredoxin
VVRSIVHLLLGAAMLAPSPALAQSAAPTAAPATAQAQGVNVIREVRAAIAKGDFDGGEQLLAAYRKEKGTTPDALEALSWLGRGALAARQLRKADAYAEQTYDLSVAALRTRKMDDEPRLPIALGAAIEVRAHVAAQQGALGDALQFLQDELRAHRATSIRARIQKNINLLSLEGKAAPPLELPEAIGTTRPVALSALKGKPVVLFFWAHWCPDCKAMSPALDTLRQRYGAQGLTIVAPTQRYGYVAGRKPAPPDQEMAYIAQIRDQAYPWMAADAVPVSEENFKAYGASTTPTVVLIDRAGIVRLYHPGEMSLAELEPHVKALVEGRATSVQP